MERRLREQRGIGTRGEADTETEIGKMTKIDRYIDIHTHRNIQALRMTEMIQTETQKGN